LSDTNAEQVFNAARVWWPEADARCALFVFNSAAAVRVATTLKVPENLRAVLLRDTSLRSDDVALQAFRQAAELVALCEMQSLRSLAPEARDPMAFVVNGRLMPLAEARARLTNALAAGDEHIDTAQRSNGAGGAAGSIVDHNTLVRVYGAEAVARMTKGE
jgi:hypothetical protein